MLSREIVRLSALPSAFRPFKRRLYSELTVRQNLELHAKLFPVSEQGTRVEEMLARFGLKDVADSAVKAADANVARLQVLSPCEQKQTIGVLSTGWPSKDAFPSVAGSRPVNIFIVVDLPSVVGRCREANVVDRSWILAIFLKKRESQSLSYGLRKTSLALARDSLLLGPDNEEALVNFIIKESIQPVQQLLAEGRRQRVQEFKKLLCWVQP